MMISYTICDEPEYVSGYGQSYLANLAWNRDLVSRISDSRVRVGARITDEVVDILEKLGHVHLDQVCVEQDVVRMDQLMVKLHLYHWLYDCVASLDSIAVLLNLKYEMTNVRTDIGMKRKFIRELTERDSIVGDLLSSEYKWMDELKKMRNAIAHGEGRLVVGGGDSPCFVLDINRNFVKGLPLHRVMIPNMNKEYCDKLDVFVEKILRVVDSW